MTANILLKAVEELGTKADIVGHIGGDDFVYITIPEKAGLIGDRVKEEFDQKVLFLYGEAERKRGYLEMKDRRGRTERFRLMSITIVIFSTDSYEVTHFAQVSDIIAELKAFGKSIPGSVVVKERRAEQHKASEAKTGT